MDENKKESKQKSAGAAKKPAQSEAAAENAAKKVYTEDEVQAILERFKAEMAAQPVTVLPPKEETVTIQFVAECNPNNVLELPGYGILRPYSYLEIPKKEFGGKFMSQLARILIHRRHVVVLDGLTDEERSRWDCDYKPGEILKEYALENLLELPTEKILSVYKDLCAEHKAFVATRFMSVVDEGLQKKSIPGYITLEKCQALQEASAGVVRAESAFQAAQEMILKSMKK